MVKEKGTWYIRTRDRYPDYNTLSGIIRSVGDSKTPLYILIAASVVNIILDLVFILVFHLGTMGAALATILSQLFSCVGCLIVIRIRIPELHLKKSHLIPAYLQIIRKLKRQSELNFS